MIRKSLYPALLVFISVSFFTFIIVYGYEIMVFLYPDRAVKLDIPFASGFSSFEKLGLNIIYSTDIAYSSDNCFYVRVLKIEKY